MDEWRFTRQYGLPALAGAALHLSARERFDVADLTAPFSSNLLRNPTGSNASTTGWTAFGGGTGGTATLSREASGGVDGGPFVRNATAMSGTGQVLPDLSNHGHSNGNTDYLTVGKVGGVGQAFTALGAGRVTQAPTSCTQIALTMHAMRADGSYLGNFGTIVFATNPTTGEWYESGPRTFSVPGTVGGEAMTNAHRLRPAVYFLLPSPTLNGGTYILDADHVGVYPTGCPVVGYRDGDATGWEWSATAHGSSSQRTTGGWLHTPNEGLAQRLRELRAGAVPLLTETPLQHWTFDSGTTEGFQVFPGASTSQASTADAFAGAAARRVTCNPPAAPTTHALYINGVWPVVAGRTVRVAGAIKILSGSLNWVRLMVRNLGPGPTGYLGATTAQQIDTPALNTWLEMAATRTYAQLSANTRWVGMEFHVNAASTAQIVFHADAIELEVL